MCQKLAQDEKDTLCPKEQTQETETSLCIMYSGVYVQFKIYL